MTVTYKNIDAIFEAFHYLNWHCPNMIAPLIETYNAETVPIDIALSVLVATFPFKSKAGLAREHFFNVFKDRCELYNESSELWKGLK